MSGVKEIGEREFKAEVLDSEKPVLVDFWAPWCAPCRMVAPVIEELSREFEGKVKFVKVNVDENPKLASNYGISSIPSLFIFKDGKPFKQIVGARPKPELKRFIEEAL